MYARNVWKTGVDTLIAKDRYVSGPAVGPGGLHRDILSAGIVRCRRYLSFRCVLKIGVRSLIAREWESTVRVKGPYGPG